jgi:RNA polymerase sigma-70 factor (ECF subfamily)
MDGSPPTRPSLILRLRDPGDGAAWAEFIDLYGPLVYAYGRRRGLQDADAADLTQDVLRAVASAAGRFTYDPARGTFRGWLFTITRTRLLDFLRRVRPGEQGSGDTAVQRRLEATAEERGAPGLADEEGEEWDRAVRQRLVDWAAERIRDEFQPTTWQAFRLCAVEGRAPRETAATLGMSTGAVYAAKFRVLSRLRTEIERLQRDGFPD